MAATTRVTIKEAARLEGVGEGAIRKRMERGTLPYDKGSDGRVYVYLPAGYDESHSAAQASADSQAEDLREQVAYLRQLLDEERAANRENRRLLAAALERIPEIEAAEPHEQSKTAGESDAEGAEGVQAHRDNTEAHTSSQQPDTTITGRLRRWVRGERR